MAAATKARKRAPQRRPKRAEKGTRADRNIAWIEQHLRVPEGELVGQPVQLHAVQRDLLRAIYDTPTRTAIFSIGRKGGKTSLSAMLILLHLVGPEYVANSQLYSAAQSKEQAGILFGLAAKMVRMAPALHSFVRIRDTAKELLCDDLGTHYRALSADTHTAYGLSPVVVVHDELGQIKSETSELYDALETAQGAHASPLSVIISTQAPSDSALLSVLIDDALKGEDPRTKIFLYTAPEDDDPFVETTWRKANPMLGAHQNLDRVREMAEVAKRMPSREAAFRNLVLNQRIDQTAPLIPQAAWRTCSGEPDPDVLRRSDIVVAGLDLSKRTDLTALVYGARDDGGVWHVFADFFAPSDGLRDRTKHDRVPYDTWARQGVLTTTPGSTVDYAYVAQRLLDLHTEYRFAAIAFDRWHIDELKREVDLLGGDLPLVPHGQGFRDMAPAIDALEAEVISSRVCHGAHPILTWCIANAKATMDPAGNRKLDKKKSSGRIDGAVAMAMMFRADALREPTKPRRSSIYNQGVL